LTFGEYLSGEGHLKLVVRNLSSALENAFEGELFSLELR
jgi:hypothetical protein